MKTIGFLLTKKMIDAAISIGTLEFEISMLSCQNVIYWNYMIAFFGKLDEKC